MTFAGVADTHAAIWFVLADPRLSAKAKMFIEAAIPYGLNIAVSPITLAEIVYLEEKRRLPTGVYRELRKVLADPSHVFKEAAFTAEVAEPMLRVPREAIPDMPDRIVAATALQLAVPILSRDGRIRASNLQTVW